MRQYAAQRLAASPEADRVRERHCDVYLQLVERDTRHEAERRIGVVEKADERSDADGAQSKASLSSGTMTAGAERIEYW